MSADLLPFERSFRDWMERHGMGWVQGKGPGRSYCLVPSRKPRRAVVALHGAGNDALFGWIGLFKDLLRDNTLIYTFDLPGHGRGADSHLDADSARAAIISAVEACADEARGAPVHAVGISLGGSLLLDALPDVSDGLASATLVVSPLQIHLSPRTLLPEVGPSTLGLVWKEREHYGLGGLIPSFGPFKRDIYPLRLAHEPPPGAFGYVESLNSMLAALDPESRAEAVSLPVLLAYGEADRIVPISQGERLAGRIPSAELVRVPKGTHLSTPLSAEVRQALTKWIGRRG